MSIFQSAEPADSTSPTASDNIRSAKSVRYQPHCKSGRHFRFALIRIQLLTRHHRDESHLQNDHAPDRESLHRSEIFSATPTDSDRKYQRADKQRHDLRELNLP